MGEPRQSSTFFSKSVDCVLTIPTLDKKVGILRRGPSVKLIKTHRGEKQFDFSSHKPMGEPRQLLCGAPRGGANLTLDLSYGKTHVCGDDGKEGDGFREPWRP